MIDTVPSLTQVDDQAADWREATQIDVDRYLKASSIDFPEQDLVVSAIVDIDAWDEVVVRVLSEEIKEEKVKIYIPFREPDGTWVQILLVLFRDEKNCEVHYIHPAYPSPGMENKGVPGVALKEKLAENAALFEKELNYIQNTATKPLLSPKHMYASGYVIADRIDSLLEGSRISQETNTISNITALMSQLWMRVDFSCSSDDKNSGDLSNDGYRHWSVVGQKLWGHIESPETSVLYERLQLTVKGDERQSGLVWLTVEEIVRLNATKVSDFRYELQLPKDCVLVASNGRYIFMYRTYASSLGFIGTGLVLFDRRMQRDLGLHDNQQQSSWLKASASYISQFVGAVAYLSAYNCEVDLEGCNVLTRSGVSQQILLFSAVVGEQQLKKCMSGKAPPIDSGFRSIGHIPYQTEQGTWVYIRLDFDSNRKQAYVYYNDPFFAAGLNKADHHSAMPAKLRQLFIDFFTNYETVFCENPATQSWISDCVSDGFAVAHEIAIQIMPLLSQFCEHLPFALSLRTLQLMQLENYLGNQRSEGSLTLSALKVILQINRGPLQPFSVADPMSFTLVSDDGSDDLGAQYLPLYSSQFLEDNTYVLSEEISPLDMVNVILPQHFGGGYTQVLRSMAGALGLVLRGGVFQEDQEYVDDSSNAKGQTRLLWDELLGKYGRLSERMGPQLEVKLARLFDDVLQVDPVRAAMFKLNYPDVFIGQDIDWPQQKLTANQLFPEGVRQYLSTIESEKGGRLTPLSYRFSDGCEGWVSVGEGQDLRNRFLQVSSSPYQAERNKAVSLFQWLAVECSNLIYSYYFGVQDKCDELQISDSIRKEAIAVAVSWHDAVAQCHEKIKKYSSVLSVFRESFPELDGNSDLLVIVHISYGESGRENYIRLAANPSEKTCSIAYIDAQFPAEDKSSLPVEVRNLFAEILPEYKLSFLDADLLRPCSLGYDGLPAAENLNGDVPVSALFSEGGASVAPDGVEPCALRPMTF